MKLLRRRKLERRIRDAVLAGLPALECGESPTDQATAEWASDWQSRHWIRDGKLECEVSLPADAVASLERIALSRGVEYAAALQQAIVLGHRSVT